MRHCLTALCLLALVTMPASADDVILKGGGKVSGRILSRTETSVEVDVGAGTVTVSMSSVVRIDEKRSTLDEYYDRAAKVSAGDAAGWVQVGQWASSQGLGTQARTAYENALRADPGNVEANQGLGRVQLDGRWVSADESYQARGYVQFENEWMTPAERDAILKQRDAEHAAELAKVDAERRAQDEAAARAREAEAAAVVPGNAGYPMYWGGYWGPGPPVWPSQPIVTPPARPVVRPPSRPPARPPGTPQSETEPKTEPER